MKKFTIILVSVMALSGISSSAQQKYLNQQFAPDAFTKLLPQAPEPYKCDSMWLFVWNSSSQIWNKVQRNFRESDGRGRLLEDRTLSWDYNLSEWINAIKNTNEYYSDTMKNHFSYRWRRSDNTWAMTNLYEYNSDGKPLQITSLYFDENTNLYTGGQKSEFSYSGLITEVIQYDYDETTFTWKKYQKSIRTSNSEGKTVSSVGQTWSETNQTWVNNEKYEITYTGTGNIQEEIYYNWNQILGFWGNTMKFVHEYNSQDWEISQTLYGWNNQSLSWFESVRVVNHYDENGYNYESDQEVWDANFSLWKPDQKITRTFYTDGSVKETSRSIYIADNYSYMETDYAKYNTDGKVTEQYTKDISMQNYQYYQGYRHLYTYNGLKILSELDQDYDTATSGWNDSYKSAYTYDANSNLTEKLSQYYLNNAWENNGEEKYFYSSYIGISEKENLQELCFFNNPLTPGEMISCPAAEGKVNIDIFNVAGQKIFSSASPVTIPSSMAAGIYVLQLNREGKAPVSGKIIIK